MSKKILGLDLGTNSIGWAIIEKGQKDTALLNKGVHIFPKGVGDGKSGEYSLASERTGYRSARRLKFRRKLRKIETLKVLIKNKFCPQLSAEELLLWRNKKIYPTNEAFRSWLLTSDDDNKHPYYFRHLVASYKLDLSMEENRYALGRALYHLAQRRGYKSNALDQTDESDGKVASGINELQELKAGKTLGQYFYSIYDPKNKIRSHYTGRMEDYLQEFNVICDLQELDADLRKKLENAIFYQRPLKSQKGNIANCPFEVGKKCIQISHPLFELFRMYQFINNIKIETPDDDKLRPLTPEERELVVPCFYIQKPFEFDRIAKQLVPKKAKIEYYRRRNEDTEYVFNYDLNTTVTNAPLIGKLIGIFGVESYDELLDILSEKYANSAGKTKYEVLEDIWHVLATFDSSEKRIEFAENKLGLSHELAEKFDKIKLKKGYGNLSSKAIKKILPFLQREMIYSNATFMANIPTILSKYTDMVNLDDIHAEIKKIVETHNEYRQRVDAINVLVKYAKDNMVSPVYTTDVINEYKKIIAEKLKASMGMTKWEDLSTEQQDVLVKRTLDTFDSQTKSGTEFIKSVTVQDRINNFLKEKYGVCNVDLEKMYHPSAIEHYPKAQTSEDGNLYLGSPRISAIKNPVFNRTMHRLKALVNQLILNGEIDSETEIHIEMTRELNDANRRKAIQQYQKQRENLRAGYAKKIEEFWNEKNLSWTYNETDILKYQLWEEQDHICPYTGKEITLTDFLGDNPKFDIEHTFPRSKTCDNSQENMTLTDRTYNRQVKKNMIPHNLPDYEDILARVKSFGWENKIYDLKKMIEKTRNVPSDPEAKSRTIVKRHVAELEMRYYKEKLFRFTAKEIPDGFASNQLRNTQTICKYAVLYMRTVFERVYSYKATGLKPFYEAWGVNEKQRISHIHHGIDAVLAACIVKKAYDHEKELYEWNKGPKPKTREPWSGFSAYMNNQIHNDILVTHFMIDKLLKKAKKKVRKRGIIEKKPNGEPMIAQGDSARGALHKDTFYGAIKVNDKVKYVVRKPLSAMNDAEMNKIVDLKIREIVLANKDKIKAGEKIWLNEEKGIEIKSARFFASGVSNPIPLKKHQHISQNDYKQDYYVVNENNYAMAIYGNIKSDNSTKHITSKSVVNSFDAVNTKPSRLFETDLFESRDQLGMPLRGLLKVGSKVILYENSPDELKHLAFDSIVKRIYSVYGIWDNTYVIKLRQNFSTCDKNGRAKVDFANLAETLLLVPKNILIEHVDFEIDILGNVTFLF
jgi:CRISPR-associated endonuclease Csn1